MEVRFYTSPNGRSPVEAEIDSLPTQASAHVYELLEGIENHALNAPRVVFRPIQGKLWEIKMNLPGVGGYRIFYCFLEKDLMPLLHSYEKKSQKAPRRHIETAMQRMADAIKREEKL